jgi:hypothetical protein
MDQQEDDSLTVDNGVCDHRNNRIVSTGLNYDGTKYKSRRCKDCGHYWKEGRVYAPRRKLSDEDVLEILATPRTVSDRVMAERFGVSREAVRQVRAGLIYATVAAEIDRSEAGRLCSSCSFFDLEGGCLMQFPDFDELGPAFARECNAYVTSCDKRAA